MNIQAVHKNTHRQTNRFYMKVLTGKQTVPDRVPSSAAFSPCRSP